jgi:putative MATE family efflux protein
MAIETNLSQGSILGKLIRFSVPFLLSNLVQSLYNVADMLVVGNFSGTHSMSGVVIGGQVTFILTIVVIGLSMGATVLIGQYIGAGNRRGLERVTATIITLLIAIALVLTVAMLALKGPILRLIRTPQEAFAEADSYLVVTVSGVVFIFGYNAFSAILRGMGNSRQPFYFVLIACITNIVLDLLFVAVFHWDAFGAALATVISQALSMILCIVYLKRNNFQFDFKLKSFKIYPDQLRMIFRIGLPTCLQNAVTSLSFLFLTAIVNTVGGVAASAAVGAEGKFNSFAFMPTQAMSASISAMSAQNIGAGRLDRAVRSCRIGILASAFFTYSLFVLVQLFPAAILSVFGDDPDMIANGVVYMRIFSSEFLIIPFLFCINGFLIGGGHTMFTLFNSVLSAVLLRVPVCYIFAITLNWGIRGVALGAPAAAAGSMVMVIIYLMTGRWKRSVINASDTAEVASGF